MKPIGNIQLHRKLRTHWLWTTPRKYSDAEAWLDMVMEANYKESTWKKYNVVVGRGQFVSSDNQMCTYWGWSRKKVRCFIQRLIDEGMIKKYSTKTYTLFEIVNYDQYQSGIETDNASDEVKAIFDYWNSKQIITHKKLTDKLKGHINARLKEDYTVEQLQQAIDNYATCTLDEKYYWTHRWKLDEFLTRGIDKFKAESKPFEVYLKDKPQLKQSKPVKQTADKLKLLEEL